MEFLENNITSLVTIFVGTFAFIVYLLQQQNARQVAARIIWLEIMATEKKITEIKVNGISSDTKTVLRNISWFTMRHLIISKFDNDEINLLDEFYAGAEIIESARKSLVDTRDNTLLSKSTAVQNELMSNIMANIENQEALNKNRDKFIHLANAEGFSFDPDGPVMVANKELERIRFISGASAGTKLKNIAKIN